MRVRTQLKNNKKGKRTNTKLQFISGVVFALMLVVASSAYAQQSAGVLLQSGLYKEDVNGDLEAAIAIYERVLKEFPKDRPIAAKALLHIGLCYETLGKQEAQKAYRRLIKEFADQPGPVQTAREHLEQLDAGAPGGAESELVWTYPTLWDVIAPSPDGRHLAFRDAETGDLAVRELETGKNHRLTHNKVRLEGWPSAASFSPDGKWIAYNWNHDKDGEEKADLRIMGIDGSGLRIVYQPDGDVEGIKPFAWFPDGKQILARLLRSDGTRQIVIVPVADGSVKLLKSVQAHDADHLSLSPDGRYVAFDFRQRGTSGPEDISLLPVDGGEEVPVIEHPADDDLLGWAPDGRTLLFSSNRRGEGEDAWVIQIIDGRPQGLPQLVKKRLGAAHTVGGGQFTRDGSFYYAVAKPRQFGSSVCVVSLDPATGKILAPPKHVSQRRGTRSPAWSPHGKYLAYLGSSEGGGQGIMVIRSLETGEERELSPPITIPPLAEMCWSPDERSILLVGQHKGKSGTYVVDVETGNFTPILEMPEGAYISHALWSPDAKAIFYRRWDKNGGQVLARSLETGKETELLHWEGSALISPSFALSPDGQQLAFGSPWFPGRGVTALHIIPTAGGEPRELLREPDSEELIPTGMNIRGQGLEWTPDGRYVLFFRGSRGNYAKGQCWRVAVEGGQPERLGPEVAAPPSQLHVHPDGKQIAFTRWEPQDQELWVMKNFLPDLASPSIQLPNPPEGNYFVTKSEDDAEEWGGGNMYLDSSDLELIHDDNRRGDQVVGIRFADTRIPKGTQIKKTYVQFTTAYVSTEPTDLTIHAELAGNTETFTTAKHNISSRKRTEASVKWSPERWDFEGQRSQKQQTPDLSSLIQEVIDQPDWQEGSALVLIITGSGERDAISFDDGGQRYAPMLHIEY